jgi:hypothetical protein
MLGIPAMMLINIKFMAIVSMIMMLKPIDQINDLL